MSDQFAKFPNTIDGPAKKAFAITPTDNTPLSSSTKGLYIGGAGNINLIMVGDTANTLFTAVTVGSILPFRVSTIHATGTTATGIVGLI